MTKDGKTEEHAGPLYWVVKRFMTKATDTLILAILAAAGLALSGLLGPVVDRTKAIWNSPIVLEQIVNRMDEVTGANRITNQPKDMSYVVEPVYVGQDIKLVLFIGRTEIGAGCVSHSIVPLFTDENGVTYPGDKRAPRQQLGTKVVKRELIFSPPRTVGAGRNSVALQLEYTCGDEVIFENTVPVYFTTLERP